jgi:hypothetical protein
MSEPVVITDGTPPATETPPVADWKTGLDPEFVKALPDTYAKKYEGKPTQEIIKSHIELEKMMGKKTEGMIKLPGKDATPEDIAAYRTAIGVPESADKYELAIPDGEDKAGFEAIAGIVKTAALEAGAPNSVLAPIWSKVLDGLKAQNADLEAKGLALMKADEEALKTEFGAKYDEFVKSGDDALGKFKAGADASKLFEAYGIKGHPAVRKLLAEIAPLVVEGKKIFGKEADAKAGDDWPSSYKYDENRKPV